MKKPIIFAVYISLSLMMFSCGGEPQKKSAPDDGKKEAPSEEMKDDAARSTPAPETVDSTKTDITINEEGVK